jgi:hypothetical protein
MPSWDITSGRKMLEKTNMWPKNDLVRRQVVPKVLEVIVTETVMHLEAFRA